MSDWEVSAVAMLDSSVNCVCVWSTKKLTMPAYCVAANCNNSQTTPGITMHELPCNRPVVGWKWIKFIQFKRADFIAVLHHAHLCSEHFSECDFTNPMEYRMSKLTRCSGTLSESCLTGSDWYDCILVVLSGKVSALRSQFHLHHCSQRALTEIVPKITPNLRLVLRTWFLAWFPLKLAENDVVGETVIWGL